MPQQDANARNQPFNEFAEVDRSTDSDDGRAKKDRRHERTAACKKKRLDPVTSARVNVRSRCTLATLYHRWWRRG